MQIIGYDHTRYDFATLVGKKLGCWDLSKLHELGNYPLFERKDDQKTVYHKAFYSMGEDFLAVYRRFIRDVIREHVGEEIVYQRIPTFRVSLPGNVAVGEFHKDSDYMHGPTEQNYWVPLTKAFATNTVWIESEPDKGDYQPAELAPGQILHFDGVKLRHGNKVNDTGSTRVSFDLRIIPASQYVENPRRTINTKMRFVVGEYFERTDTQEAPQ